VTSLNSQCILLAAVAMNTSPVPSACRSGAPPPVFMIAAGATSPNHPSRSSSVLFRSANA
jgi:hypothetical protein